jgi:hypothetical protein
MSNFNDYLLDPGFVGGSLTVLCAHCESPYTHQKRVETYARKEDSDTGIYNEVDFFKQTVTQGTDASTSNPSSRRDGIRVVLTCEECNGKTDLTIVQHKGNTFLSVEKSDER